METEQTSAPNLLKDFAHARQLLRHTSRGKNPDWYREAVDLDCQLHLLPNPLGYEAFLRTPGEDKWLSVPELPAQYNEETLEAYIESIRSEFLPRGARSLGVILHLNQDASVFEFQRRLAADNGADRDLQSLIVTDPAEVLQDRTLTESEMSFRIFPTPANPGVEDNGFAVAVSNDGVDLLRALREVGDAHNFPIRTSGLSIPLLLLSKLPRTIGPQTEPFCVMLAFDGFSFFGFFSQEGELILIRSIKHVERKLPQSLENVLSTTAASVELASLNLKVFDCRRAKQEGLDRELSALLFTIPFNVFLTTPAEGEDVPIALTSFLIEDGSPELAFGETVTFGNLVDGRYHLQDFLAPSAAEVASIPNVVDMKLLRFGRIVTRIGVAACVLVGAGVAYSAFTKMKSPEWSAENAVQDRAAEFAKDLGKAQLTEKMLADRSKGWVSMELLARLLPLDGSVQFSNASHEVTPNEKEKKSYRGDLGMVKNWKIEGFANDQGTKLLGELESPVGMGEVFEETKQATANSSLELSSPSRSLTVKLDLSENARFRNQSPPRSEESYPYQFTLNITQRIENSDPLAIPSGKIES